MDWKNDKSLRKISLTRSSLVHHRIRSMATSPSYQTIQVRALQASTDFTKGAPCDVDVTKTFSFMLYVVCSQIPGELSGKERYFVMHVVREGISWEDNWVRGGGFTRGNTACSLCGDFVMSGNTMNYWSYCHRYVLHCCRENVCIVWIQEWLD